MNYVGRFFQTFYVEPNTFFTYVPYAIYGSIVGPAKMAKIGRICDMDLDCAFLDARDRDHWIKDYYTNWDMYINLVNIPIALCASIIFSAQSDKTGRQKPMLLGLTSLLWAMMGWAVVCTRAWDAPYFTKLIFTFVTAAFGENTLQIAAANSFMADIIPDKQWLTIRMNILAVLRLFMTFVGFLIIYLTPPISFEKWMLCSVCIITMGFIYILVRIPQIPPKFFEIKNRAVSFAGSIRSKKDIEIQEPECMNKDASSISGLKSVLNTFRDTWAAFKKPREGHLRFMICTIAMLQFISGMLPSEIAGGGSILQLFMMGEPFEWGAKELAYFNIVAQASTCVGSLVAIYIFKKLFHLRDTTIILMSMFSAALGLVPIIIAGIVRDKELGNNLVLYASNLLVILGSMQGPTMASFIAKIVPLNELGRIYVAFGAVGFVSQLIYASFFTKLFAWTQLEFMSCVWVIALALNIFCLGVMVVVHIYAVKEKVEEKCPALTDDKEC